MNPEKHEEGLEAEKSTEALSPPTYKSLKIQSQRKDQSGIKAPKGWGRMPDPRTMRTHSPECSLGCCSLAALNRASLSNLAPVWSVIVRQERDVWGGGSIWVIRWMYGLSLSGKKRKCVWRGSMWRNKVSKGSPPVLHRKGTGEAWEKTGQTLMTT